MHLGKHHVMSGIILPQPRDRPKLAERIGTDPSLAPPRGVALPIDTLTSDFQPPAQRDNTFLLFEPLNSLRDFVTAALEN